jgi:hypothetical protein
MFIASIDPGVSTGVAIYFCKEKVEVLSVQPKVHKTFSLSKEVPFTVFDNRCRLVVMEDKPTNADHLLLPHWYEIYYGLTRKGFEASRDYNLMNHPRGNVLFLVPPAMWKPFMKSNKYAIQSVLKNCSTQHEKDAAAMLHYFLKITHPTKEIYYGKS